MSTTPKHTSDNNMCHQLIETIDKIFESILHHSYAESLRTLTSIYDKYVTNSTYLKLFINTTLSHITAYHIYNPIFGSFYKQLADAQKHKSFSTQSNSVINTFEMTLLQILQNKFQTQWHEATLMKFIGSLYLENLLPISFIDECLDELSEHKLYPTNLSNQHIISICELLQAMDKILEMSQIHQIILKYYHGLMFIDFHRSKTCVNIGPFAASLIQETLHRFNAATSGTMNDTKSRFNVEQLYWNLITFGMVRNMARDINVSIQDIAMIINEYVCECNKTQQNKEEKINHDIIECNINEYDGYNEQIQMLSMMGYNDTKYNVQLLVKYNGDFEMVLMDLLSVCKG